MPRVFVSYSSNDKVFVEELAWNLTNAGIDAWYADWEIGVGDSVIRKIQEAIQGSDFLIAVLSPASMTSHWVREELETGMAIAIGMGAFVLPLLLQDCKLPPFLMHRRYADFRTHRIKAFEELVKAIRGGDPRVDTDTWVSGPDILIWQALLNIFKRIVEDSRKDTTQTDAHIQEECETTFEGMRDWMKLDGAIFPIYIQVCIEKGKLLRSGEFIHYISAFIEAHPEATAPATDWLLKMLILPELPEDAT